MRWIEIVEGSTADEAGKEAERRLKANRKLDDTRRKKTEANRKYQDSLKHANDQQRDALSKLSKK